MKQYKYEVQNICSSCSYKGDNFKLYQEVTQVDDFGNTRIEHEIVICPKCEYEEKI